MSAFGLPRSLAQRQPQPDGLFGWISKQFLPSYLALERAATAALQAFNDGSFDVGGVTIRVVTGVPIAADVNGSVAFRTDGGAGTTLYHREGGAWVARA